MSGSPLFLKTPYSSVSPLTSGWSNPCCCVCASASCRCCFRYFHNLKQTPKIKPRTEQVTDTTMPMMAGVLSEDGEGVGEGRAVGKGVGEEEDVEEDV